MQTTQLQHYRIPTPERYFGKHAEVPPEATVERLLTISNTHPYFEINQAIEACLKDDLKTFQSCFLKQVSDEQIADAFAKVKTMGAVDSYHGRKLDRNTFMFLLQGDWRESKDVELFIILAREEDVWKIGKINMYDHRKAARTI